MSGEKPDTFELVLHCLFVMPEYLAIEKRFDVLVLTLTLLINLVEHCEENRTLLLKTLVPQTNEDLFSPNSERKTAAEGLVQMFLEKEENAKREESKTGKYLTTMRCISEIFRAVPSWDISIFELKPIRSKFLPKPMIFYYNSIKVKTSLIG